MKIPIKTIFNRLSEIKEAYKNLNEMLANYYGINMSTILHIFASTLGLALIDNRINVFQHIQFQLRIYNILLHDKETCFFTADYLHIKLK